MADIDSRKGTVYHFPEILDWVSKLHAPHDTALQRAFDAPQHAGMPSIQVGPSEGRLIGLLVRLVGARRIVEIGTLAGYSALHLARSLPGDGKVWTLEQEPGFAEVARRSIAEAGLASRAEVRVGRALDLLPGLESSGPFDAVFIDADKESYDAYGRWAARNTRRGGLLLADNVFLFGKLLEPGGHAMRRFHEEARDAYDTVCIPTPDGLLLGIRH